MMDNSPEVLVSVILPVHNGASYVDGAVNSVFLQTIKNIELIVCDDASTDDTSIVLATIDDPRLRVIRNNVNLGPGLSRDMAISLAKGKWLAFIDADDQWLPERLERLISTAQSLVVGMIFDDILICHDVSGRLAPWKTVHGRKAFGRRDKFRISAADYISSERMLAHVVVLRSLVSELNVVHTRRRFGEDAEFILSLLAAGVKLAYLPEPLYLYRILPGSLTDKNSGGPGMREMLQESSGMPGWGGDERQAFAVKIESLRINELLYELRILLLSVRWGKALHLLLAEKSLWKQLPRSTFRYISFHMHRVMRGGVRRNTF